MDMSFESVASTGVARISGSLMIGDAESFRQAFAAWFSREGRTRVVVDMSGVDQLDSAGLGVLVAAARLVRDKGGDLCFAGLNKRPRMVFEITRSHRLFDIYATVDEALRANP
jgi:anti-sigma B factor antagonist